MKRLAPTSRMLALLSWLVVTPLIALAQGATVSGTVTRANDGTPLPRVNVSVSGTRISAVTGNDGNYVLRRVPAGQQTILFRWIGYRATEVVITVTEGGIQRQDAALEAQAVALAEIVVEGVSRAPERVVEAPAAVSVVDIATARSLSVTGQAPRALAKLPGADVVQSGINDFNVNSRGFNSTLNRRMLVLQDGRDLAIAFLGSQEWNALSMPLEDLGRIEMVRGPGSALYGANAFSGVVSITTPTAREVVGSKLSIAGGEISTFRADFRHADVVGDGRFGYRVNLGYYRSDTWTRSRTDVNDLADEYFEIADDPVSAPFPGFEVRPLNGQQKEGPFGLPGATFGDRDFLQNAYGSGRFDYYANDGSIFTLEGGGAQVENEVFVTGIGRVQVTRAWRPYARAAWAANNFNVMAWYSGRISKEPQYSLSLGVPLEERSALYHAEGQYNRRFYQDRGRVVVGASARSYHVDTQGTLMSTGPGGDDDRADAYYSVYGQVEFDVVPQVRLVAAARVDDSDLFETQFSPKGAIVFNPTEDHGFRFTVNRAFQTPNYSEFFLQVGVTGDGTTDPRALEDGLETYFDTVTDPAVVGPALASIMSMLGLRLEIPWNFDPQTRALALGNPVLDVETVTSFELGYKGTIADRAYVSLDFYLSDISNFVTDLLPVAALPVGNPKYTDYSLTDDGTDIPGNLDDIEQVLVGVGFPAEHPLRVNLEALRAGFLSLDARSALLATLANGSRAFALSYGQAGEVTERGVEFGLGIGITPELRADASYTFFDFDIDQQQLGQDLVPNTPKHKGAVSLSYIGLQGIEAGFSARFVDGYDWEAGVFAGSIPSSQSIDVHGAYQLNPNLRLHAIVTNVLDQERYHLFGGSVIGRRFLGGMTAEF